MRKLAAVGVLLAVATAGAACGEEDETGGGRGPAVTQDAQDAQERQEAREARREAREARRKAREARQARRERAARREARRRARIRAERRAARRAAAEAQAQSEPEPAPTSSCDPNYAGACLDPDAADYDCAGGSGDGPLYTGRVEVVGSDVHGLDRDGDGVACE